jgi:hypothetical protein
MAVPGDDQRFRTPDFGVGLRARLDESREPDLLDPISPELVLVSPPELARLARELLPDPPAPAPASLLLQLRPPAAAVPVAPAKASRGSLAGVAAFYVLCLANSLTPLVLAIIHMR